MAEPGLVLSADPRLAAGAYDGRVVDLLRSVWHEPPAPDPPARVWRDWALVAAIVPTAIVEAIFRPDVPWRIPSLVIALALTPLLLWRRTHPLLVVSVTFGTLLVLTLADVLAGSSEPAGLYTNAFVLILPYSLFRWGSGREAVIGLGPIMASAILSIVTDYEGVAESIGGAAILLAALALGEAFRYRARARSRELDQVKLVERERLARDLHDTVAHHVSAIAIRAQAGLAAAAQRPAAASEALRVIEAEASRTLTEMRSMVRVLRDDEPAARAPTPQLDDLRGLAGDAEAGPPVEVEIRGDLRDLPPTVGTAVYRLAQESVTNARRHARHATRIEVQVEADDTTVRLRVHDDGDSSHLRSTPPPGYGLLGMIERTDLLGGSCRAGPDPDRGWTVSAELPRAGSRA